MATQAGGTTRVQTKNTDLVPVKAAKTDEVYAQWADIEFAGTAYFAHEPDIRRVR